MRPTSRDGLHYELSQQDRRSLAWNQTASRRQTVPTYANSLTQGDVRMRKCQTCGKVFPGSAELQKHVQVNHTGSKPVVCHVCGKRFGSTRQMTSHYRIHNEPRLDQFGILTRRNANQRDLVSPSSSSQTTVGSFHRIPKTLKTYMSDPSAVNQSYGTNQTFNASVQKDNDQFKRLREYYPDPDTSKENVFNAKLPEIRNMSNIPKAPQTAPTDKLPDIHNKGNDLKGKSFDKSFSAKASLSLANKYNNNDTTLQRSPRQNLPKLDAGSISVIDSVMGVSKAIETSARSNFTKIEEEKLIKSRMEEISLASRPQTARSLPSRGSGMNLPDIRKPRHLENAAFWDTGSQMTGRMSEFTGKSGYDPYRRENLSTRGRQRSVVSFPRI